MMLLGIILGSVIAFAIVILIQMYDTRIRNIEELSFRYKVSILGEIINWGGDENETETEFFKHL